MNGHILICFGRTLQNTYRQRGLNRQTTWDIGIRKILLSVLCASSETGGEKSMEYKI